MSKTIAASTAHTQHRARLLFDANELQYQFGKTHPLHPNRLRALVDVLASTDLWHSDNAQTNLPLRHATLEELGLIHSEDYIRAVQQLGSDLLRGEPEKAQEMAMRYGFGSNDTPAQPHMHEASSHVAGGTLVALSAVMGLPEGGTFQTEEERPLHVFHPAGGLHHAWSERASGFCVYNDAAVAIAHVLQAVEAKVLYIDFDAHHGDGVQRAFYDDPRVMTISLHETGRYLFPGSGDVLERGNGSGRGYSVNVPLEPFTDDDSYIETMDALLLQLVTAFAPDVIVSQHGCDTHSWDPLTHMCLTTRGIVAQIKLAHQLAHTYCQGRWLALGGGGYALYRVVPRVWAMLWAEMSEQPLPEKIPDEWIARWRPIWERSREHERMSEQVMGKTMNPEVFPTTFHDPSGLFPPQPRRWSIGHANRQTVGLVRHFMIPGSIRQAFPTTRSRSPMVELFDLLHFNRNNTPSRIKTLQTQRGPILLRDFCPPSLIERLRADSGLGAFARIPEREHQLMLDIAQSPDCALTVAHTPTGEIIGQVTIAPADSWWEGVDNLYEIAIEVSANWRGLQIAQEMLTFALELDAREDMIFFAIGLSWHWDAEGLGISMHHYRELIKHLFGTQGFVEYSTTEPNVSMEPTNVLVARIGSRIDQHIANQFLHRLMQSSTLSRF
jgi:acetoin utilization deacetylase AcuC-like enzyme